MPLRRRAVLFGVVLSLGCTDTTAPASLVNGTWTHDFQIPGNGFQMTLSTQSNIVTGDGSWVGEACCGGPVTVTGKVDDGVVKLDMAFSANGAVVPPFAQHFEGRVPRFNTLSGTLTATGQSIPYSYRRMR